VKKQLKKGTVRGIEEALGVASFAVAHCLLFGRLMEWSFQASQPFRHRLPHAVVHTLGYGGLASISLMPDALVLATILCLPMGAIFKRRRFLYSACVSVPSLCLEVAFLEGSRILPTLLWSVVLATLPTGGITALAGWLTSRYPSPVPSFNIFAGQARDQSPTPLSMVIVGDLFILISLAQVAVAVSGSAERDLAGATLFIVAMVAGLLCAIAFRGMLKWALPAYSALCAVAIAGATIKGVLQTSMIIVCAVVLGILTLIAAWNWTHMRWRMKPASGASEGLRAIPNEAAPGLITSRTLLFGLSFLLFAGAVVGVIYEDQYPKYRNESDLITAEIAETQSHLKYASKLAPRGDDDLSALNQAIARATRELSDERRAFVSPSRVDAEAEQQIAHSLTPDVRVVDLHSLSVRERDFYREHIYRISLAGTKDGILSTLTNADRGPLLISWSNAQFSEDGQRHEALQLTFAVYSLVEDESSPATFVLSVCKPQPPTALWLPWLQQRLSRLSQQRESLCDQGKATPERTAGILRLIQIDQEGRADLLMAEGLRRRGVHAESLVNAAMGNGR
jgi:hypothetical protein